MEVEKCEFDGRTLRLVTGWVRGKNGSRMLTRLTSLRLTAGRYRRNVPREIRELLLSGSRTSNSSERSARH